MNGDIGTATAREIGTQPQMWARALDLAAAAASDLPMHGQRVLAIGCGTSFYVADAYARSREAAGHGETDALVAGDLPVRLRPYEAVVAVSRSGTSRELLDAIATVRDVHPGIPVTAVLGERGTPLEGLADYIVDLAFADESSVVQTRFATTAVVLLRASVGQEDAHLVAAAADALVAPVPKGPLRQIVLLAHGWAVPLAYEGALKLREAAGAWAEAYSTSEYRHGPVGAAASGTLVWGITPLSDSVVSAAIGAGATVRQPVGPALAELVVVQRLAVHLALASGRDPDRPAHLSRSVLTS